MVHVFSYSFEWFTAPGVIQFHGRQATNRWGTNLDATAPMAVRFFIFNLMKRWGIPGTPLA